MAGNNGGKANRGSSKSIDTLSATVADDSFPNGLMNRNGKVENQKQVSHFPTAYGFPFFDQIQKGGLEAELRSLFD